MNSWGRRAALLGVSLTVALVVAVGAWLGPWVRDDQLLDAIVRAVALDWRDFGPEAATRRLQYELDHQGIGHQVGDQSCWFEEPGDGSKVVGCAWSIELEVPFTGVQVPLSFESVARIDPSGDLR